MRALHALVPLLLAVACASADTAAPHGSSVLLVTDVEDMPATHAGLLKHLDSLGRKVTRAHSSFTKQIDLITDGAYTYDAIIVLLTGRASLDRVLPISALTAFVDAGRSLLVATGSARSSYADRAAELLGVDTDEKGNVLVDYQRPIGNHTGWVGAGGVAKTLFGADTAERVATFDAADGGDTVAFRGSAGTLFRDNELVAPLIWGSGSAFGRKPATDDGAVAQPLRRAPRVGGAGAVLAAGVTTWSGGRAAWFGSADALSDEGRIVGGATHAAAMDRLVGWAVGERGVLRVARVAHGLDGDEAVERGGAEGGPGEYRVKDVVRFVIEVQEWDGARGEWKAFEATDLQVEFVMLNPWVRARLHAVEGKAGVYSARIQVPDQIGVYKFKVEYVRPGVTPLRVEQVVPVRPFWHNEYERFIPMAAPYYVASLSMMGGVFVLAAVLLLGNVEEGWDDKADKSDKQE